MANAIHEVKTPTIDVVTNGTVGVFDGSDTLEDGPELTRDMILAATDSKTEVINVPEWGGKVRVKGLTGKERDRFEMSITKDDGKGGRVANTRNIRAKLVVLSCVDATGNQLFRDEDVLVLGEKSAAALDRVFEVASRLSRVSPKDEEELLKNSGRVQQDDLLSD